LTSITKIDPIEKERSEVSDWLNHCLDDLKLQMDQFEAEIECDSRSRHHQGVRRVAEPYLSSTYTRSCYGRGAVMPRGR